MPGYEAPVNLAYSQRNRSAVVRIPMYSPSPKAKRVEFRCPDPSCNPYLAFSAMLMAVIDGIQNKIDPGEPLDKDIYDLAPEELAEGAHDPRLAGRGPARPAKRPRVPACGATCSPGRDRHLDRVQDEQGSRRDAAAPASVRVLPVLSTSRPAAVPRGTVGTLRPGPVAPCDRGRAGLFWTAVIQHRFSWGRLCPAAKAAMNRRTPKREDSP